LCLARTTRPCSQRLWGIAGARCSPPANGTSPRHTPKSRLASRRAGCPKHASANSAAIMKGRAWGGSQKSEQPPAIARRKAELEQEEGQPSSEDPERRSSGKMSVSQTLCIIMSPDTAISQNDRLWDFGSWAIAVELGQIAGARFLRHVSAGETVSCHLPQVFVGNAKRSLDRGIVLVNVAAEIRRII
jgi:hypothetical protein